MFRLDSLVAGLARKRLWITDAYFVGVPGYIQALCAAVADGVDVRLLVPGGSDLPLVRPLSRAGYRALLEGGVRVFEWNGSMVHAKTAVADGQWARVGSTNLNIQSWMGNWELDVAIEDTEVGAAMERMFEADLERFDRGRAHRPDRAPVRRPRDGAPPVRRSLDVAASAPRRHRSGGGGRVPDWQHRRRGAHRAPLAGRRRGADSRRWRPAPGRGRGRGGVVAGRGGLPARRRGPVARDEPGCRAGGPGARGERRVRSGLIY